MSLLDNWVRNPHNVRFVDLCREAERLGFELLGVRGSHHRYGHKGIRQRLVLTRGRSGKAQPYRIRQLRALAIEYGLGEELEDE